MDIPWQTAFANFSKNKNCSRYPSKEDGRFRDNVLIPDLKPKFTIKRTAKVLTIGSCFAREIEERLVGFDLPARLVRPGSELFAGRSNGVVNEYNAGTIQQRLNWALQGKKSPRSSTVRSGSGYIDLLMPVGEPITESRLDEVKADIDNLYCRNLLSSEIVIITLGLVECWYDKIEGMYLNRMPPMPIMRSEPDRYSFRTLDVAEVVDLMKLALEKIVAQGIKVLLTVSPVPLWTTFSGRDAVIANNYSKGILRVAADELAKSSDDIDYFPSFEIVSTAGLSRFLDDNIHIQDALIATVTDHMITNYIDQTSPAAKGAIDAYNASAGSLSGWAKSDTLTTLTIIARLRDKEICRATTNTARPDLGGGNCGFSMRLPASVTPKLILSPEFRVFVEETGDRIRPYHGLREALLA